MEDLIQRRETVGFCRARGIEVIDGACPYMFLPRAALFHRVHGFLHRLFSRRAA